MSHDSVIRDFNIKFSGPADAPPLLLAHGFGCDQTMWRFVVPEFSSTYRVITFDFVGAGGARIPYNAARYSSLQGYASDLVRIVTELDLREVHLVGHSVSSMIGALATIAAPDRFESLVMIGPTPRYINDGDYQGGFTRDDIEDLLENLEGNYLGWSQAMGPAIMGQADRPALGEELTNAFCRMDPEIAANFAAATFLADNREDLSKVTVPTLVMQCSEDIIAGPQVGQYVAEKLPEGQLVMMAARGHCPHLSEPAETVSLIREFLARHEVGFAG